jgi:hypothetical protein
METHGTSHLDLNEFAHALQTAEPGKPFVYATGDIAASIFHCGAKKKDMAPSADQADSAEDRDRELFAVRAAAWDAYARGDICLTQRRRPDLPFRNNKHAGTSFEYLATKRAKGAAP